MKFESKVGGLKILITDDDKLETKALGLTALSIDTRSIMNIVTHETMLNFSKGKRLTLHLANGTTREIPGIYNKDYDRFLSFFPNLEVKNGSIKTAWYDDATTSTHIAVYTSQKEASKEMEAAYKKGWTPQAPSTQNGKFSAGKALVGNFFLPGVGLLAGAMGNKDKITITYIRDRT